jgi:hypothetical protein
MTQCIRCGKRDITHKKRQLCAACWVWLKKHDCLDEFPATVKLNNQRWQTAHEGLAKDLRKLIDDPKATLQVIGNAHSLTRERVRQIFKLHYGFSYGVIVRVRQEEKKATQPKTRRQTPASH